jgi:DNA-binding IclR family transcriptional regulator
MQNDGTQPNYPIASVDRALRLLLHLRSQPSIGLSEAAKAIGVGPSTAHRLFDMLKLHGFAEQDAVTHKYRLGPALVDIGLAAVRSFDLRREARPYLEWLSEQVQETVHLTVLRGSESLFIDVAEAERTVRTTSRLGVSLPAHTTSGGKAILAHLPLADVERLYPEERIPTLTPNTLRTRQELYRQLAEIRERGYAVNLGESEADIGAVAVVLRDRLGQVKGALAVAVPITRLTPADVTRIATAAMKAAQRWHDQVQMTGPVSSAGAKPA